MWNNPSSGLLSTRYIPHGHCYLWQTPLVGLHAVSDLIIALSYFSIPIALVYYIYKRKPDVPVRVSLLFSSFILLCGVGHLFDIVTLWYPVYWLSGAVRAATALVSGYTAVEVALLLPQWLAFQELENANQALQAEAEVQEGIQRELEESQRVFRGAFYDIPIGMVLVSLKGAFLEANEAILKILGYSKAKLLALDFQSITHPEDLEMDLVVVRELMAGNCRYYQLEKRYFHKLGHIVPVELSVSLLRDSYDNPLMFIAHIKDVSDQHQANASLKAAKQAAETANRAKSNFLAMMSHEIRTPMNAMLGMAELIGDTQLDRQQQEFVEAIRTSGKTLLTVINDILDFSKIEANKLELEAGRLDIYECIEDVLTLFANQAEAKGLALTSFIKPAYIPTAFKGDPVRLRQILSNLVGNSIKFTNQGEVSVRASVSEVKPTIPNEPTSYYLQFSVVDTGIGIEKQKIPRLFEPFSQIDSSVTRQYGGTGLGLSISKRLIERMGGALWVESEFKVGSTFHFSLVLDCAEGPSRSVTTNPQADLAGKRLLIVAANQTNREHLSSQAESWQIEASVAASKEEALAVLTRNSLFDAIAIDETSLAKDSVELALTIRSLQQYQTVPLLLLQPPNRKYGELLNELETNTRLLKKPIRRSHFYCALVQLLLSKSEFEEDDSFSCTLNSKRSCTQAETTETIADRKPLKILLTEDIALNQKVALHMLSSYSYQADIANDGEEAIEALKRQAYDLVLMDVQMPRTDGLEATRQIRANPSIHQPYIVAMTASAMQGDREKCLSVGMDDYISKPISKHDLLTVLQQCPPMVRELTTCSTSDH